MLTLAFALVVLATPGGAPCADLELRAVVSPALDTIDGAIACRTVDGAITGVTTYPRLLRTTRGLDDRNWNWFYPEGFDAADLAIWENGASLHGEGAVQEIPPHTAPLRLTFRTRIPHRHGTFGRSRGVLYALGGWAPMPVRGTQLDARTIAYDITVPEGVVGFVGGQPIGRTSARRVRGQWFGTDLPMMLAPQAEVDVRPHAILVRPSAVTSAQELRPLLAGLEGAPLAQLQRTLADGANFIAAENLHGPVPIVVVAPLRETLVEAFDGGFAVSDRAFAVAPWEIARRLHRRSIWQAQLTHAVMPLARRRESRLPAQLVAEAVAAGLVARLTSIRYGSVPDVATLLAPFAIIPEVEALVFAPQVPFADTYFRTLHKRRIEASTALARAYVQSEVAYEELLARHLGPDGAANAPAQLNVDPHHRLSPQVDDQYSPSWRLLLNNIDGLVSVTAREVTLRADFTLHRVDDPRRSYDAALGVSPTGVETTLGTSWHFGRAVTPLWLTQRIGVRASAQRYGDDPGGDRGSEEVGTSAFYVYDDRVNPYSSFRAQGWALSAGAYAARGIDSHWQTYAHVGGGWLRIWQLALGQALATRLRADALLGSAPTQSLLRLGDRYRGGRGFERGELHGRRRAVASVEQRHSLEADANTDFAGLLTVSRIEGALFADAVWLDGQRSRPCADSVFYDVGYGLRFIGEWLAISPAALAIDVGVPLNRCASVDRPPVTIYLAFVQSFLAF